MSTYTANIPPIAFDGQFLVAGSRDRARREKLAFSLCFQGNVLIYWVFRRRRRNVSESVWCPEEDSNLHALASAST
jgi:hypothetical protein